MSYVDLDHNTTNYYIGTGKYQSKLISILTTISLYYPERRKYYQSIFYLCWKIYNRFYDTNEIKKPVDGNLTNILSSLQLDQNVPTLVQEILLFKNITKNRLEIAMDECILYYDSQLLLEYKS